MAFDPNDPADKKIVDAAVAKAVAANTEELTLEHEASTAGLKKKRDELLAKIAKGEGGDPEEVTRLETQVTTLSKELKDTKKSLTALSTEHTELQTAHAAETGYTQNLLMDNALNAEFDGIGVQPQFRKAVTAMLKPQLAIKVEGSERKVLLGGKPLGDGLKEWSQGDEGKTFVAAKVNGGAGNGNKLPGLPGSQSPIVPNSGGQAGKAITLADYNAMQLTNPGAAGKFFAEGGSLVDAPT